jgi:hypothetical protein
MGCNKHCSARRHWCRNQHGVDSAVALGTAVAWVHKPGIRDYLAAVVIFCDEVKGKAVLALSCDLDVQYKTAFAGAQDVNRLWSLGFSFCYMHVSWLSEWIEPAVCWD